MPLTILSDADVHSLLLTLTRDDIAELQYVFSEPTFPPLDHILSLEKCLQSLYSRDIFRSSSIPPQIGNADCEIVIQAQSRRSAP